MALERGSCGTNQRSRVKLLGSTEYPYDGIVMPNKDVLLLQSLYKPPKYAQSINGCVFLMAHVTHVSFPAKPLIERHNSVGLQAVGLGDVPHDDGSEAKLEGLPRPGDRQPSSRPLYS